MDDCSIKRCSSVPKPKSRLFGNSVSPIGSDLWNLLLVAEKAPSPLRIFMRRKIHTVFITQFLLVEAEEGTESRVHEERLTFQVLHRNPDGTRVENIIEKLSVRRQGS